jgi:hypothetical protein
MRWRSIVPVTGGTATAVGGSRQLVQMKYCPAACCPWAGVRTRRRATAGSDSQSGFRGRGNSRWQVRRDYPSGSIVVQVGAGDVPTQPIV